jgi:hypothetical protein
MWVIDDDHVVGPDATIDPHSAVRFQGEQVGCIPLAGQNPAQGGWPSQWRQMPARLVRGRVNLIM